MKSTPPHEKILAMQEVYGETTSKVVLCCPSCGTQLNETTCLQCAHTYLRNPLGQLDLRLIRPKTLEIPMEVGSILPTVELHLHPQVQIPRGSGLALSLGCGDGSDREKIETLGYQYVGVDWEPTAKDPSLMQVDAHALPFQANTFDLVSSHAVLEHIQFPLVFAQEAYRVLKSQGVFVGTCAFLEPQHGGSFYHHTHLGVLNTLHSAGFSVERICPTENWTVMKAQLNMGYFPWVTRYAFVPVFWLLERLHEIAWFGFHILDGTVKLKKKTSGGPVHKRMDRRLERVLRFAGSFIWLARKP